MSAITHIEKIPEEIRNLVETGLMNAIKRGKLGQANIDSVQIENSLSGGKTGAAVFVARYGFLKKQSIPNAANDSVESVNPTGTTYIRVLKIAPKNICQAENEGYIKTRETLLDIFSQVEYYHEDEFENNGEEYGILLYQDVGTVAASDLKGVARYFIHRILSPNVSHEEAEKFSRELSLLLQKEVFLGLKKGLYGNVQRKTVNLSEFYGDKISNKVKEELAALRKLDSKLPDVDSIINYFNIHATYHQVNFIHGDLNPENVLVWENERGFLSCKLIDFGEVIPKKNDNFTPLFWDFSRLLGEVILNCIEESVISINLNSDPDKILYEINGVLNEFWNVVEAFFKNDSSKLENADKNIGFISRIYLSTLFDFINEAKSGMKDLRRAEVMQDYFYCQTLFFLFYAKFQRENPYKRIFGIKLAVKFYEYSNSGEIALQSVIQCLEKFYFEFSSTVSKNKQPQIGPAIGAHSPYMGLSYFEEKDKDYFFGREAFVEELLNAIEQKPIIVLAGASGSGKSSVVHAGVFPVLRKKDYMIYKFRPGSNPIQAVMNAFSINGSNDLRNIFSHILKANPDKKLFLLGDQFEELFTLTKDDLEKRELGAAILDTAREYKDRFRFFLTIRADFLTKLLEDPSFASVIGDSGANKSLGQRFLLSPMSTEELRTAIEKPLEVAKLKIQEGLTDLILTSVANQPGSLPLLEFCLEELWKRQIDFTLQYNSYKEIGEVKGALATYADQEYEKLEPKEKENVKKIMLQLIQPGQGTEDTRRVALLEELDKGLEPTVFKLADKRLITTGTNEQGKQKLEVIHEALIREWVRLREWINVDREFRVWQEKLRYAVKEWDISGKDDANLLRGNALVISEEWYVTRKEDLGVRDIEFVEKSVEYRERIVAKDREAEAKKDKFKKFLYIVGVAVFTFSLELSNFSFMQMNESDWNENKASAYAVDVDFFYSEKYLEDFYILTKAGLANLEKMETRMEDNELTQKLFKAIANYTFDLKNTHRLKNIKQDRKLSFRIKYSLPSSEYSFSKDMTRIISNDGSSNFFIRETKTGKILNTIELKSGTPYHAFFWNAGKSLICVTKHQVNKSNVFYLVKLIDINSGREVKVFQKIDQEISKIDLSSDGKTLLILTNEDGLILRDLFTNKEEEDSLFDEYKTKGYVQDGYFTPDGQNLLLILNGSAILINLEDRRKLQELDIKFEDIKDITFSADGNKIGLLGKKNIFIWDLQSEKGLSSKKISNDEVFRRLVFSPDGNYISYIKDDEIVILNVSLLNEVLRISQKDGWVNIKNFDPKLISALIGGVHIENERINIWALDEQSGFESSIYSSIDSKKYPESQSERRIVDLLFDSNFNYQNKPFQFEVKLGKEDMMFILLYGCNSLFYQLENWSKEVIPPFSRREINKVKYSCKEIMRKGKE